MLRSFFAKYDLYKGKPVDEVSTIPTEERGVIDKFGILQAEISYAEGEYYGQSLEHRVRRELAKTGVVCFFRTPPNVVTAYFDLNDGSFFVLGENEADLRTNLRKVVEIFEQFSKPTYNLGSMVKSLIFSKNGDKIQLTRPYHKSPDSPKYTLEDFLGRS